MSGPLGFQSELEALDRKRQLAYALRLKMMQGRDPDRVIDGDLMLNFSGGANARRAEEAAAEIAALDEQQKGLISGFQDKYKSAVSGLMDLNDPFADVPDAAERIAAAQMMGINTSDILKQRQESAMLRRMLGGGGLDGGAPPAPEAGVSPAAFGPAGPVDAGADVGGGGVAPFRTGFEPQPKRAPAVGGGSGGPLSGKSDGELRVWSAVASGPAAKLAAAELKARDIEVKAGPEGLPIITIGGRMAPPNHPIYAGIQEAALAYQKQKGNIEVDVAGRTAGAQDAARAEGEMVTIPINGRPTTMTRAQAAARLKAQPPPMPSPQGPAPDPSAPIGGAPTPAPAAPGGAGGFTGNFQNARPEEVEAALRDFRTRAAPPPSGPAGFGVGQTPAEITRADEAIKTEEQAKRALTDQQIKDSSVRYEGITGAVQAAQAMKPIVAKLKELDQNRMMTNQAPGVYWKAFAEMMNSMNIPVDERRLANAQTFDSEVSKMVQAIASNFKGSQSDKELMQLIASLPNLRLTAPARKQIYAQLERKFRQSEANYESATEAYKKGSLIGWQPPKIERQVIRTGTQNGKRVVMYDDGTTEVGP
jgi:hypothetical protein